MDGSPTVLSGLFAARYTIEATLGLGATSTVYHARDTRTDRPVAIKVLRGELAHTIGPARFLREIRLTEGLHHPRILPVLDSGESEGQLYFVLPYMDGGTLRQRLEHESQLPLGEAIAIACTVAEALAYAHTQGFVHRDVKPENILFSEGEACLADFGIARAIERAIADTTTSTGIARGTPAYMSPEQASAAREYDGRSDIYSLACVLYEMIAGMRPFLGPTTQAVISQRFQHPPRELKVYRPNVPPQLESVIRHAMQLLPADRYRTAAEFAQALRGVPVEEFERRPDRLKWLRELGRTRARRITLGAGLLLAVGGLGFGGKSVWSSRGTTAAADTTRIVLLPLEGRVSRGSPWRDDDLMHQALSRWQGLHVVDQFQVADGLRRIGTIESVKRAGALASSLGAGRYIRGQLTPLGRGWRAYIALYDVGSDRALYTAAAQIPTDLAAATAAYSRLADSLLLRGVTADSSPNNPVGSRSLPAVQAFSRAQAALDEWDLSAADSAFQAATVFDPDYARASLWLAQVRAWRSQPLTTWTSLAERAAALSAHLSERERHLATALLLLGRSDYGRACDEYAHLRTRNDHDFAAWFGLGQCRMMDRIVLPDPSSPSKWRFRSSAATAMDAYAIAFKILPSVHRGYERGAFEAVRNILLVSTDLRVGYRQSDSALFYARPAWISDSLVLVPYPWQVVFAGDRSSIPPGFEQALARRRADFRTIAAAWSAAFPRSASAKHAVAISLELLGDASSIDTLRLARRLEPDSTRRLKLAAAELILLIKFAVPDDLSRLRAGRLLADSLLLRAESLSAADAEVIAPVAALSGRCAQVDLLAHAMVPAIGYENIPALLIGDANALVSRIAMGCRLGQATLLSVSSMIDRTYGRGNEGQRRRVEQMLLYRPVVLGYSADRNVAERFTASSGDSLLVTVNAALHGDKKHARTALMAVETRVNPGAPTPDITLARARLWLYLGDNQRASRTLDSVLDDLRSIDSKDLSEPGNAGSLVSAMILRAELAWASGDRPTARRWASAAGTLWLSADRDLKPALEIVSQYSRGEVR